jgi:hypothetical protein
MQKAEEPTLTPEFLKRQLRTMADLDLSEEAAGMLDLLAGLVAVLNTLQPEGYAEAFPALLFRPVREVAS